MNISDFEEIQKIKYNSEEIDTYIDVKNIVINNNIDIKERIELLMQVISNPYILKCGNTIVEIQYSDDLNTIEDQITNYLRSIKNK